MEKRIAGPYDPLYPDVMRKLRDDVGNYFASWLYFTLISFFYVVEEWGDDPVWVHGIVRATKTDIAKEAGVPRKSFDRGWKKLTDAGIVKEQEDGKLLVPYYKKKGYDSMSAREIREMNEASLKRISKLEALHTEDPNGPGGEKDAHSPLKEGKVPLKEDKVPLKEDKVPLKEGDASLLRALKETSLSSLNNIISDFYRGIGQKRIAKTKRERAFNVGKKLRQEGFSLEDIAFAVEWTLENAEKQPYDFAIIQHTIGQALAARDKSQSEDRAIEEHDKAVEKEQAERETEEREREELETHKATLNQEERQNLREKARKALGEDGLSAGMITDFLIEIKERELLRKQLEEEDN